jgi:adenosylcobinamide-GDP ribazoletransferase
MRRAVAFLTPLGGAVSPGPDALAWFPVVGGALGLMIGGVWWVAAQWWPPALAAAIVVGVDLALTGMLHFDGLIDSADGLLAPTDPGQRLAIMATPDAGAFGVCSAVLALLCRWVALGLLHPAPLLLAGLWALSRTAMAVIVRTQRYVRSDTGGGLVSAFVPSAGSTGKLALAAGVAGSLLLAGLWRAWAGPVAVVAAGLGAAGVVMLARRRIGGYTGDVLGAAGVVAETVGLMVAAARW